MQGATRHGPVDRPAQRLWFLAKRGVPRRVVLALELHVSHQALWARGVDLEYQADRPPGCFYEPLSLGVLLVEPVLAPLESGYTMRQSS